MFDLHFQRIQEAIDNTYTLGNLSKWIAKNTKHEGRLFSYVGREYQQDIIDDPAKELYVVKCAQVGLSEILARWGLAAATTQDNFTVIYTFPAANDSYLFAKARMDPLIASSKEIMRALSKTVNSVELKQFGENSFMYIRGTYSETGALSVPADLLIHDELDRSDMGNVAAYVSRLQAKPTKMRRLFSTPTVAKYGIDAMSATSKKKKQLWTCSHCNHKFLPSYHDNVVIPGYDGKKKEINKLNIKNIRWKEAVLLCPRCGRIPDSALRYREWVVENSLDSYEAVSYFITPFCAPSFITAPYLVEVSTKYEKWSEFVNQALGETAEDAQESLTESDIRACHTPNSLDSTAVHFMGADMGVVCHITIGRLHEGTLLVVHREKVFYTEFETRRRELCAIYRVILSVHDLFPYTDIITRITNFDPNAYGAVYVEKKSSETYYLKEQEEDPEEGRLNVRSAMINRNVAFDELMYMIKRGEVVVYAQDDEFVNHLRSMKRVQKFDKQNAMRYVWDKTDGTDHYHHALLYLHVATKLRGAAGAWTTPGAVPLVMAFAVKPTD